MLPDKYGRTQSDYIIPADLEGYRGKTTLLRIKKDLGPITKLLPAIEYMHTKPKGAHGVVITVDDDIGYPKGLIRELILGLIFNKKSVISGSGQNLDYWNVKSFGFPYMRQETAVNTAGRRDQYQLRDVVEGFAGVAYKVEDVDYELMKFLSQREGFKECFFSDDLLISFVLAYTGVNRYVVNNHYFKSYLIKPFPYGLTDDALHNGGGLLNTPVSEINAEKYQICYNKLVEAMIGFDSLKLKKREKIFE